VEVETISTEGAETIVIAIGAVARSAKQAVLSARKQGVKAGLLKIKTIWPFPDKEIEEIAGKAQKIIVAEMNLGQMAHEVEWVLGRKRNICRVNKIDGDPITPAEILQAILE